VPVANHGEDKQQEGNQQQAGSLRSIDRVAAMLGVVVVLSMSHDNILRRTETRRAARVTICFVTHFGRFSTELNSPIPRNHV
jgi:hypothetical protein